MKKLIALILSVCALCSCAVLPTAAETEQTHTLTLEGEGEPIVLAGALSYVLPASTAPEGKQFVGWQGELAGEPVFLPEGADIDPASDGTLRAVYIGIQMRSKPQIRYDVEGLRYLTKIDRSDLEALEALTEVGFGTLITPKDHLKKNQALNHGVLTSSGKAFLDVVTAGLYTRDEETCWLAGSVGHIKTKNNCRELLAAGYLTVAYTNGETGYIYAPVTKESTVPHLYQLAVDAYRGGSDTERVFLNRVLDTVVNFDTTRNDKTNDITNISYGPAQAEGYVSPYTARYERDVPRVVITIKPEAGLSFKTHYAGVIIDGKIYDTAFLHNVTNVSIGADGSFLYIKWTGGDFSDFY
jgi:hypothetical protein